MGIVNCSKHGRTGLFEVCRHVDELFVNGTYSEFRCLVNMLWCDDRWEKYDLVRFEDLADRFDDGDNAEEMEPLLNDYLRINNKMARHTWCEKCIAALQASSEDSSLNNPI